MFTITITQSVGCALGSMCFAGINDLVFKKQAMNGLGRGQYLSVAGMGISYKLAAIDFHALPAADRIIQNYWFIAIQGLIWVIVGLLISIRFEGVIQFTKHNVGYGVLSGGLICGIVLLMARAVATGDASVAIPITQMSFLVTSIISWPLTRERFPLSKIMALGLAAAAVLFLTIP